MNKVFAVREFVSASVGFLVIHNFTTITQEYPMLITGLMLLLPFS